jgi:chemotaxis protein methyltransferase CheR
VNDTDCTAFLQWALPRLDLCWLGFRKVRRQVCKRLKRRLRVLQLASLAAYRERLEADPTEWSVLDECCHITISRFFRDKRVFGTLRSHVLPELALRAERERRAVHIWSAGCGSGEEPYTIKILWDLEVAGSHPGISLSVLATDVDVNMLARAQKACFEATSLRELPPPLVEQAFDQAGALYCVRRRYRRGIDFVHEDLRSTAPAGWFDVILCRYVAFTYFAPSLQREVLARIVERLLPNGYLVIGTHEHLPGEAWSLVPLRPAPQILQKVANDRTGLSGAESAELESGTKRPAKVRK